MCYLTFASGPRGESDRLQADGRSSRALAASEAMRKAQEAAVLAVNLKLEQSQAIDKLISVRYAFKSC